MTVTHTPPDAKPAKRLGDVNAVAEKCDCSPRHIYRLADSGKLPPPRRLGALVRWDLDEIDEWIDAGCPAVRHVTARGAAR